MNDDDDDVIEVEPAVREVLHHIYERDGELTAETVLDEARRPDSRLHRHFEWDDSVAGEQWRLHQARRLINGLTVTLMDRPVREFVHIPSRGSYAPVRDAIATKEWRDEFLAKFEADARAFEARWATHKYVSGAYVAWLKRQARKVA